MQMQSLIFIKTTQRDLISPYTDQLMGGGREMRIIIYEVNPDYCSPITLLHCNKAIKMFHMLNAKAVILLFRCEV